MYFLLNKHKNPYSNDVMFSEFQINNEESTLEESTLEENFEKTILLGQHVSKIGNYYVGIIFGLIGKATKKSNNYCLKVNDVSINDKFILELHQIEEKQLIEKELAKKLNDVKQEYWKDNYVIVEMLE